MVVFHVNSFTDFAVIKQAVVSHSLANRKFVAAQNNGITLMVDKKKRV